jgi:alkylation response protein AidB-like acyl-CoA dehydrogenase
VNLNYSADDERFRDEVRAFLDAKLTEELRETGRLLTSVYADIDTMKRWHRILFEKGWVAPSWPREYGGCGWTVVQRHIFASELAAASAPPLSPMGLGMCGPALIGCGSDDQKRFYLPRILSGEDFWCQGYSEPNAGSDLASLQMAAEDNGDDFLCNGQKIWTTHAQHANRIFCLVRTSKEAIPQRGITFLLIDMDTPGIVVKPLTMLSGEQIQNEIFFRDVRVPKKNAVGRIGEGWTVAKYLLQFERGGGVVGPGLRVRISRIRAIARSERQDGASLIDDMTFAARLAKAEIDLEALEFTEHRVMAALSRGAPSGPEASMMKTLATELSQHLTEIAVEAVGYYALAFQPEMTRPGGAVPGHERGRSNAVPVGPDYSWTVTAKYLNDRAASIYGGSNEIQRNIMAKAVFGL